MKDGLSAAHTLATFLVTYVMFGLIARLAGMMVALWVASVLLAFCFGAFWAAGDQKRKRRARREGREGDA